MAFAASCVDSPVPAIIDDPLGMRVCRSAAEEAYIVAKTQADRLEMIGTFNPNAFAPDVAATAGEDELRKLAAPMRDSIKQHMGIWRDLAVKKRKTEVDMQTAVIVAKGQEQGIPTPINAAVLRVIHEIEDGTRGMGWENLAEIALASDQ
jgi:2-dehydropantoate 2-reductase